MSLDIGVGDGESFVPLQDEPRLAFENDAYFWFLWPQFETLHEVTGEIIELYETASFSGGALDHLQSMLKSARSAVEDQPEAWDVCIGYQVDSSQKGTVVPLSDRPILATAYKKQFFELLDQWERVIHRARKLGRPVVCFGD